MVDYVKVEDARDQKGLRLALTMGVPGPWSRAAKYIFEYKGIAFIPVGQMGARENAELYDWTGHRNAPVAVYGDEAPRVGWYEIIMLAERIAQAPGLLPHGSAARAEMFGPCLSGCNPHPLYVGCAVIRQARVSEWKLMF